MIKIILSIFCIFSINVYAETFYTDYNLIEENSTKYKEEYKEGALSKVERKVGYNNYEEIINMEGYYELGHAPSYLNNIDMTDYINKDIYSKKPFNDNNEQYNTMRIRKYSSANSIALRSFITSSILKNINITYDGLPVEYTITESNYDFKSPLLSSHMIVLNLGKKYNLDKINIKLIFEDDTLNEIRFMLNVYSGNYYLGSPYVYYDNEVFRSNKDEIYNINFINSNNFDNLLSNITWIRKKDYSNTNSVNYYKGNIKLYKYYSIIKKYLNIYTTEPLDGYKLDNNQKINLYDYYQRDYITIKDDLDDLNLLNNIILSSSIPLDKISIESKITDKYILAIIKYKNSIFYKKYPILKKEDNSSNELENKQDEIKISNSIDNIQEEVTIPINNKEEISNSFFDIKEEQIIEKDSYFNKKTDIYKTISSNNQNNDKTIALLIPQNNQIVSKNNNEKKSNYTIIYIILLIICVKFFTQYLNKKKCFVEPV